MNPDWTLQEIELASIVLRDDVVKREVDRDAVADLVDSIRESGLHNPIRVRPIFKYKSGVRTECWELIAGRHRIEAAKALGWEVIAANVTDIDDDRAELAMIDENLMRKDLEPADLVYQTDRRKVVYERLHPDTVHGGDRKSSRNNCDLNQPESDRFTLATAKATGRSERSVQMAASIGKKLKDRAPPLVGTSLNSITELDALAKLDDALREDIIDRAMRGEEVSAKAIAKEIQKAKPKKDRKPKAQSAAAEPTTNTPAPEVAAAPAFFQGGEEGGDPCCGTESHKQQQPSEAHSEAVVETSPRQVRSDQVEHPATFNDFQRLWCRMERADQLAALEWAHKHVKDDFDPAKLWLARA